MIGLFRSHLLVDHHYLITILVFSGISLPTISLFCLAVGCEEIRQIKIHGGPRTLQKHSGVELYAATNFSRYCIGFRLRSVYAKKSRSQRPGMSPLVSMLIHPIRLFMLPLIISNCGFSPMEA